MTLHDLRPALVRSDAFVYAIAIDTPEPQRDLASGSTSTTLNEITGQSGGRTEVVRDTADLRRRDGQHRRRAEHQYVLGYSSPHPGDGQYHSIRVRMINRDGYKVRARNGYVAARRPTTRASDSAALFCSTHVVMQRWFCTLVVLIGSSSVAADVRSRRRAAGARRRRSDRSRRAGARGRSCRCTSGSMPMLDARRAKNRPPRASTRHISSSMRSKWPRSRAKCSTALQMTASMRPSGHGSTCSAPWRMLSGGSVGASSPPACAPPRPPPDPRRCRRPRSRCARKYGRLRPGAAAGVEDAAARRRSGRAAADRTGRCRCRRTARGGRAEGALLGHGIVL